MSDPGPRENRSDPGYRIHYHDPAELDLFVMTPDPTHTGGERLMERQLAHVRWMYALRNGGSRADDNGNAVSRC